MFGMFGLRVEDTVKVKIPVQPLLLRHEAAHGDPMYPDLVQPLAAATASDTTTSDTTAYCAPTSIAATASGRAGLQD